MTQTNETQEIRPHEYHPLAQEIQEKLDAALKDGMASETNKAVFDAARLLDGALLAEGVEPLLPLLTRLAPSFARYAEKMRRWEGIHPTFANIALNYLMLAYERHDPASVGARELLNEAYAVALQLVSDRDWSTKFPPAEHILGRLTWQEEYSGPAITCNIETARAHLMTMHKDIQGRKDRIERALSLAKHILWESHHRLHRTLSAYYEAEFDDVIFRQSEPPAYVAEAKQFLLMGRNWIKDLDGSDITLPNVYRCERSVYIMRMMDAQVSAVCARMIVDALKSCKAYENYEVLGYQALAYAELTQLDNWDLLAAPVTFRPEEPISKDNERRVFMFERYGACALRYAQCLEAQIACEPKDRRPQPLGTAVKLLKELPATTEDREVRDFITPWRGSEPAVWVKDAAACVARPVFVEPYKWDTLACAPDWTQDEMTSHYIWCQGNDKREMHHYAGAPKRMYPKHRLVGFQNNRGLGGRRRKRAGGRK